MNEINEKAVEEFVEAFTKTPAGLDKAWNKLAQTLSGNPNVVCLNVTTKAVPGRPEESPRADNPPGLASTETFTKIERPLGEMHVSEDEMSEIERTELQTHMETFMILSEGRETVEELRDPVTKEAYAVITRRGPVETSVSMTSSGQYFRCAMTTETLAEEWLIPTDEEMSIPTLKELTADRITKLMYALLDKGEV